MEKFVVIMAGGVGSRFWPRSRKAMPKQLLNIFGENTMIQDTVDRLKGFVADDHTFIITNKVQKAIVEEQLPEIPPRNIIAEPEGRNTAPCVGLAASIISGISTDAVIITLPADHLINDVPKFKESLQTAVDFAHDKKGLVTFGINPTRPETGYGYINFELSEISAGVHSVNRFVEKPDLATAEGYLNSGDYLWNSGMFIWRADVILEEIKKYLPELLAGLTKIGNLESHRFLDNLNAVFPTLENISIDYGIMEKSDKVFLVKGDFGWSDVGSWESVYELTEKDSDGNAAFADSFLKDSSDNYIYSPDKFTAVIGAKNLIVIDTKDALLICEKSKSQDVKLVVEKLKKDNRPELI